MVSQTRFKLLTELQDRELLNKLIFTGILGLNTSTWFDIYKHYLEECKTNQKPIAIQFTADHWSMSERNLFRIIKFMETDFSFTSNKKA